MPWTSGAKLRRFVCDDNCNYSGWWCGEAAVSRKLPGPLQLSWPKRDELCFRAFRPKIRMEHNIIATIYCQNPWCFTSVFSSLTVSSFILTKVKMCSFHFECVHFTKWISFSVIFLLLLRLLLLQSILWVKKWHEADWSILSDLQWVIL